MDNKLKHVGVLGMKWGIRSHLARSHERAAETHRMRATRADKLIPQGGNLQRKAAERHEKMAERLKGRVDKVTQRKMTDLEKKESIKELKSVAKVVGLGLATLAAVKLSSIVIDKAMQKIYSGKIADALGDMLLKRSMVP